MDAKKNDLVVVMIRKRPKLALYVEETDGHCHVVNVDTQPGGLDLRIVSVAAIRTLTSQPETP